MSYGLMFALAYGVGLVGLLVLVVKNYKPSSYDMSKTAAVALVLSFGLVAACVLPLIAVSVDAKVIRNTAMREEGVPDVRLAVSGARALETLSENVSLNIDWSNSESLPDDVVRQLAENQAELLSILREQSR